MERTWRKDAEKLYAKTVAAGELLETYFEEMLREFPEINIQPHWGPPALDWCVFSGDLDDFNKRVFAMQEWLEMPPNLVSTEGWLSSAPELRAVWRFEPKGKSVIIFVRTLAPANCVLEETEEYVKVKRLNKRCADAIAAIETTEG